MHAQAHSYINTQAHSKYACTHTRTHEHTHTNMNAHNTQHVQHTHLLCVAAGKNNASDTPMTMRSATSSGSECAASGMKKFSATAVPIPIAMVHWKQNALVDIRQSKKEKKKKNKQTNKQMYLSTKFICEKPSYDLARCIWRKCEPLG